ncbi:MAG: serpin family protein [Bacteroidaceae bacterium]|nr:serpin family protein [Paraprevotella sp.]MDY4787414.1 serpin family protein [Bacteroidaceae bacterium]MDY5543141.1 serpin family protein [Bacteroidaceae bacterium]
MMKTFALMGMTAMVLSACRTTRVEKAAENGNANWSVNEEVDESFLILSDAQHEMVNNNNSFAFSLYNKTMGMNSRVVSPLSVTYLMSMLANGADGETQQQILATLGWAGEGIQQPSLQDINDYSRMLIEKTARLDKAVTVEIANYVAVNKEFKLNSKFQKSVERDYKAGVESLNFTSPSTLKRINDWCNDRTHGMIPSIINELDPDAVSYLMNAIYFNGTWKDKFSKEETKQEMFRGYTRDIQYVDMMHRHGEYFYADGDGYSAVSIPYGNGAFRMTVILPSEGSFLRDVMASMDGGKFQALQRSMEKCNVDLKIPRFTTEVDLPLNDIISALGAPLIFSSQADFSQFARGDFYVSKMFQKAKIEVSEEGTKAAAVTAAIMMMSAVRPEKKRNVVFHADSPFAYIISENSTGSIYFMGQYTGK